MPKTHHYTTKITWTGNTGTGTSGYTHFSRDHEIEVGTKTIIKASSDPAFRGDPARHNPEELFLSSLSSCHMLWFLHLCTVEGVVVVDYQDEATGVMEESANGSGKFIEATLHPVVTVAEERMVSKVDSIHSRANKMCFIANSCNFPVKHSSTVKVQEN
ncbi:MAG: OsmC family protein [Balneolaceae bacterium]|nr:OsmC family protein [Balneolaceae bacterium]